MSDAYGVKYKINGHRAGIVQALGGVYRVIFERCYSENTLESIEEIDWQNVTVEQVGSDSSPCPLPEGYTFTVREIEHTVRGYFTVILKTDKQHWGDVTPYQAQIDGLNETVAQKEAAISTLSTQLAEADELAATLYEELEGTAEETTAEAVAEAREVQA